MDPKGRMLLGWSHASKNQEGFSQRGGTRFSFFQNIDNSPTSHISGRLSIAPEDVVPMVATECTN